MKKLLLGLGAIILLMLAQLWVSSGTLGPYAITLDRQFLVVQPDCGYVFNMDHEHFVQTDLMIAGYPLRDWKNSVYLRLVGYPILARPFAMLFGFNWGRFLFNLFAFVGVTIFLWRRLQKTLSSKTLSLMGLLFFVTLPTHYYWGGMPYHHAVISLLAVLLYFHLDDFIEKRDFTLKSSFGFGLGAGVGALFYEMFLPIFLLIAILYFALQRKPKSLFFALLGLLLPVFIVNFALSFWVPVKNSNSEIYFNILKSFIDPSRLQLWAKELLVAPRAAIEIFFDSSFLFLPVAFLCFVIFDFFKKRNFFKPSDALFGFAYFALFCVTNLAPPYEGWNMRGSWIARIYQPVYVVYFLYLFRSLKAENFAWIMRLKWGVLICTLVFNLGVIWGSVLGFDWLPAHLYGRFYKQGAVESYSKNLDYFGRRPLGFCREGFKKQNPMDPDTSSSNLPTLNP